MLKTTMAALVALSLAMPAAWAADPALLLQPTDTASAAALDLAAIKGLGGVTFGTSTPWTDGKVTFEAVPGDRILPLLGGGGRVVQATALDDYAVEIPIEDFKSGKAYISYAMNGEPRPTDQFGPFLVVYRYDADPSLADETHQARSIWQLKSLSLR